ncbi:MAG: DUF2059 domain-containing protein [Nitrospirae bacterium]|nr:DUF2059 domain-containing protein [Nitrospirota bacterium]
MTRIARIVTVIVLLVFGLSLSVLAAESDKSNDARVKAARRYMQVTPMNRMIEGSISAIAQRVPPDRRKEFMSYVEGLMRVDVLEKIALDSLVKTFTAEELNALADFYGSPVGRSIMNKYGAYMADIMPALQQEIVRALGKAREEGKLPLQGKPAR